VAAPATPFFLFNYRIGVEVTVGKASGVLWGGGGSGIRLLIVASRVCPLL
jgi:hypothetical protein